MYAKLVENCEVCTAPVTETSSIEGYPIGECLQCGHQFVLSTFNDQHVDYVYGDDYFFAGGAGYPDYLREGPDLVDLGRRYARIVARYAPEGRMLDVGSAAGFILKGFADSGWSGSGVEPNGSMVRYARETLGVDVAQGAFEDYRPTEPVDLVAMIQVISHFYDLNKAIRHAGQVLKPGGLCLVETWDRRSIAARISGWRWHEYSPPSVVRWFTRNSLRKLLEANDFSELASGRPHKGISGEHARSLLEYKLAASRFGGIGGLVLKAIPSDLRIPYPGDDLFWAIFQKNCH